MKIIRPASIGPTELVATSATEAVAAWAIGTTYAEGAQVLNADGTRIFTSLQAANTGHALTDADWWFDAAPANRWAMFDTINGTVTTGATGLDVSVRVSSRVDTVALLNVQAASVHVTITDDYDEVLFDETFSMVEMSGVTDYYLWATEPIVRKTDLFVVLPQLYSSPTIRVEMEADGDPVSVGTFLCGQSKTIGETALGASVGITDYSRKEVDEFGNYQLVERSFARKGSFNVLVEPEMVDEVYRILSGYRATPVLYNASDEYRSTFIFGIFRDFNAVIEQPTATFLSLEIEGLT